jgi:hypothetical protein
MLHRGSWGVVQNAPDQLTCRVLPRGRGVTQLYSHQAEAISHVFGGSSLVAATPTASGKSLTYCIPVSWTVADLGQSVPRLSVGASNTCIFSPTTGGKSTYLCCLGQVWGRISMGSQLPGCFRLVLCLKNDLFRSAFQHSCFFGIAYSAVSAFVPIGLYKLAQKW